MSEVKQDLKKENFTHIIDLHSNLRSLQIKLFLPSAKILTYRKGTIAKWKRIYLKSSAPNIHVVDRYLKPLQKLDVFNDGKGLEFFIPTDTVIDWKTLGGKPGKYIAFVIGAAHFTKRLPNEKLAQICKGTNDPIYLVGGPDVQEVGHSLAQQFDHVINTCGLLSFMESARLIELSTAVIAQDTGFMHIAAALRKPLISIWGSTDPQLGFWPLFPDQHGGLNHIEEVNDLSCRPCSKFGRSACPKGHFKCMHNIHVEAIAQKINTLSHEK